MSARDDGEQAEELAAKVAALSRRDLYAEAPTRVERRETHMSWVFLTDRHAYKLKKPVSFDAVDYRALARRERACRDELRLNRRLADWVYLDVVALLRDRDGTFRLADDGASPLDAVEWLVKMRRLDTDLMLDACIEGGGVDPDALDAALAHLMDFYRRAEPVGMAGATYRGRMRERLDGNIAPLLRAGSSLDPERVRRLRARQRVLLDRLAPPLEARAARVIEAHGDLRPEHVWLGRPPAIIDCLEFDRERRLLDPLDELAFLALECERMGAAWIGRRALDAYLADGDPGVGADVHAFRESLWAVLRARAAVSHLFDPTVQAHARWARKADDYLGLAERKADAAEVRG